MSECHPAKMLQLLRKTPAVALLWLMEATAKPRKLTIPMVNLQFVRQKTNKFTNCKATILLTYNFFKEKKYQ